MFIKPEPKPGIDPLLVLLWTGIPLAGWILIGVAAWKAFQP